MKRRKGKTIVADELTGGIRQGLIPLNSRLLRIAAILQERTNRYTSKKKKLWLLFFTVALSAKSTLIVVDAVSGRTKTNIAVSRIKTIPIEKSSAPEPIVTRSEFFRVFAFKNYIDSLSKTAEGWKLRDSLLCGRPLLMDSTLFVINLYLKQSKTSVK